MKNAGLVGLFASFAVARPVKKLYSYVGKRNSAVYTLLKKVSRTRG